MDEMSNKREERICMLEELLGKTEGADQNIIEILNQYYSNSWFINQSLTSLKSRRKILRVLSDE